MELKLFTIEYQDTTSETWVATDRHHLSSLVRAYHSSEPVPGMTYEAAATAKAVEHDPNEVIMDKTAREWTSYFGILSYPCFADYYE